LSAPKEHPPVKPHHLPIITSEALIRVVAQELSARSALGKDAPFSHLVQRAGYPTRSQVECIITMV
jgi:hypothetical protein